jgi:hypothetical protein
MRKFQFSLRTVFTLVLIVTLIAVLVRETSINWALRKDNRLLRRELGIPDSVSLGNFYLLQVHSVPVKQAYHQVWRIIVPEGYYYWVRVRTCDIPISDTLPDEGTVACQLSSGEAVLHAMVTSNDGEWTLRIEANDKELEIPFDGAFLTNGGVSCSLPLAEDGIHPPQGIALFKGFERTYQIDASNASVAYSKSGLLIWLQRVTDGN